MRRFLLVREEDVSGTSGLGVVAEGVEFSNGRVAVHWLSQLDSYEVADNIRVVDKLHGNTVHFRDGSTMTLTQEESDVARLYLE